MAYSNAGSTEPADRLMALFAIWQGGAADATALTAAAHIVPERIVSRRLETGGGGWNLWAGSCASHFYEADAQVWIDSAGGACIIHGLIWRTDDAALLDARDIARLLDMPGARLPEDVAGEYAVARLYADGTLEAFGEYIGYQGPLTIPDNLSGIVMAVLGLDTRPIAHRQ